MQKRSFPRYTKTQIYEGKCKLFSGLWLAIQLSGKVDSPVALTPWSLWIKPVSTGDEKSLVGFQAIETHSSNP
jgi:hypothetical protein